MWRALAMLLVVPLAALLALAASAAIKGEPIIVAGQVGRGRAGAAFGLLVHLGYTDSSAAHGRDPNLTAYNLGWTTLSASHLPLVDCFHERGDVSLVNNNGRGSAGQILSTTNPATLSAVVRTPQLDRWRLSINPWPIAIPVAAPGTVLLIGSTRRRLRERAAFRRTHCRRCGYDLQATPERCPECGTAAARGNT